MQDRQRHWPLSINGTSTHDTKRGEDVRARLNVLSELPEEWLDAVRSWQKINEPLKKEAAPDCNDEYFIYQSLIGTWPMPGQPQEAYGDRLKEYLQKALREAKRHSNWTAPDTAYEEAAQQFALSLLDQQKPFWKSFRVLQEKVAGFGVINSLVQTVLKFTCPGVPDVYQGCEAWDLSFVDPDNRRPVDFEWRAKRLKEIKESEGEEGFLEKLWEDRFDAGIKIWLTQKLMHLRRQKPQLLTYGDYQPLEVEGKYREHVLAFARSGQGSVVIVAVPLFAARLCTRQGKDWEDLNWEDTIVKFPGNVVDEWESVEGEKLTVRGNLSVNTLFKQLPFAVLKGRTAAKPRGAGVLLHLSSLPSPFGIGDMGPEAYAFADFLGRSRQKYWQLLPLNPTEEGQGHSPYSSISSMAGNPLFISPQLLIEDGLLEHADLEDTVLPPESRTLYAEAGWIKGALLDTAFERFSGGSFPELSSAFEAFRKAEAGWLEDFALYSVLKDFNEGRPWYQWEEAYKLREKTSLLALKEEEKESVTRVAFIQFLFSRQWQQLKGYCNGQGIQMLGDLPIYVSYDSADVWANRELFKLNENGERLGLAGVPPDAFSADGQLWGMPVYDWDALKETGYQWWITRLKKNCELFDLVRLDHFRAFADYWEVPAGEKTAKNGSWKPGPGAPFFEAIEKALGELPFVAEDLGEINDAVIRLRDQFHLPGMKILQFAFDDNMPGSDYIPHNYTKNFLVYTGTHDNNTVRGWYRDEANEETRTRVQQYIGRSLAEEEVHSELCRLAFASVANLVILPVQDLLGLGTEARMNIPASGENNWAWRLLPGQINEEAERQLQQWTKLYGRA
jgi:4-alpha-glucanotransferase